MPMDDLPLFSQIPAVICRNVPFNDRRVTKLPKKKIKFADEIEEEQVAKSPEQKEIEYIDIENLDDSKEDATPECSSSSPTDNHDKGCELVVKPEMSDAIVQTEKMVKTCSRQIQTDESLLTRPLNMSDYDLHRNHTQAQYVEFYKPMYRIPKKGSAGDGPPLKIGLSLPKGVKRKVFYPDEENGSQVDGA